MVRRRHHQFVPQRRRPLGGQPGRCRRADRHFHRNECRAHLQLSRTAARSGTLRRYFAVAGRGQGRPRPDLHADDRRGGLRHAGVRAHRRRAFRGVRWFCRQQPGQPHRRCAAKTGVLRRCRFAQWQGDRLQAAARRSHPHRCAQAAAGAAGRPPSGADATDAGSRRRLRDPARAAPGRAGACHLARIERAVVRAVHLGHDG